MDSLGRRELAVFRFVGDCHFYLQAKLSWRLKSFLLLTAVERFSVCPMPLSCALSALKGGGGYSPGQSGDLYCEWALDYCA